VFSIFAKHEFFYVFMCPFLGTELSLFGDTWKSLKVLIYQSFLYFLKSCPSHSIYKGLFSMQGSGSIFLPFGFATPKKSPPFPPCIPKFGRCWLVAKPTILKTRNLGGQLALSIVPAEPPVHPFMTVILRHV